MRARRAPAELERSRGEPLPRIRRRDLFSGWAKCFGIIAVAKALSYVEPTGLLAANLAGVAAFFFIAVPDAWLRRRGEPWSDYGLAYWGTRDPRTWRAWGRGLGYALRVCAVMFPIFFVGFYLYGLALPFLPRGLAEVIAPYGFAPTPRLRLPEGFAVRVAVQLLVVALPEEIFYRGWMQSAWDRAEPAPHWNVFGARIGPGFFRTQLLFAIGHLVVLQPWRLMTFFPGVLFGWVRARTGNVAAPIFVHALSNLFIAVLETSWYGG